MRLTRPPLHSSPEDGLTVATIVGMFHLSWNLHPNKRLLLALTATRRTLNPLKIFQMQLSCRGGTTNINWHILAGGAAGIFYCINLALLIECVLWQISTLQDKVVRKV